MRLDCNARKLVRKRGGSQLLITGRAPAAASVLRSMRGLLRRDLSNRANSLCRRRVRVVIGRIPRMRRQV
jgi:hypothetical protein